MGKGKYVYSQTSYEKKRQDVEETMTTIIKPSFEFSTGLGDSNRWIYFKTSGYQIIRSENCYSDGGRNYGMMMMPQAIHTCTFIEHFGS